MRTLTLAQNLDIFVSLRWEIVAPGVAGGFVRDQLRTVVAILGVPRPPNLENLSPMLSARLATRQRALSAILDA